ncbi:MAG: hypothetical protein RSE34_00035 [Brevundimonas sp.]
MTAVEVRPLLERAVEPAEQNVAGAELKGQVQGLEPSVRSPSDLADVIEDQLVDLADVDSVDPRARRPRLG